MMLKSKITMYTDIIYTYISNYVVLSVFMCVRARVCVHTQVFI